MKPESKKRKPQEFEADSILNTNSAKMTVDTPELSDEERRAARKQKTISIVVVLCVLLALAAVFILGGVVSNYQEKKRQEEEAEAARIAALKDPRADTLYIVDEDAELLPFQVQWSVIDAYYSNENGMYATMNFTNGFEVAVPVKEISVWLYRGEDLVVSGRVRNIVDLVIPANSDADYTFYMHPSLVKITDLKEGEEDLSWKVEVTYDLDPEDEKIAYEERADTIKIVGEEPEVVSGKVSYSITNAYYTKQNGMFVTVAFANGTEETVTIGKMDVALRSKSANGEMLPAAAAEVTVSEDKDIAAGEVKSYTFYIDPNGMYNISLTKDDVLEWEITYEAE